MRVLGVLLTVLFVSSSAGAQGPSDLRPKALVGGWTWRGVDTSLEEVLVVLYLGPGGEASMIEQSAEELANGENPKPVNIKWRVEYPSWPTREGRRLCIERLSKAHPDSRCRIYSITGTRPNLVLIWDDREWSHVGK